MVSYLGFKTGHTGPFGYASRSATYHFPLTMDARIESSLPRDQIHCLPCSNLPQSGDGVHSICTKLSHRRVGSLSSLVTVLTTSVSTANCFIFHESRSLKSTYTFIIYQDTHYSNSGSQAHIYILIYQFLSRTHTIVPLMVYAYSQAASLHPVVHNTRHTPHYHKSVEVPVVHHTAGCCTLDYTPQSVAAWPSVLTVRIFYYGGDGENHRICHSLVLAPKIRKSRERTYKTKVRNIRLRKISIPVSTHRPHLYQAEWQLL